MKNIWMVLLLAVGLSAAAAESTTPGEIKDKATMCYTRQYALCIKAACSKTPDAQGLYSCECVMQSGWNMGPNTCKDRSANLTSTYSNNFNTGSNTISCPAGTKWAWCYGATCTPDPNDPSKAICKCPVSTKPSVTLVSTGMCSDSKVCGILWSAATPGESTFANNHYYNWLIDHGIEADPPATPPATPCPTTASN
jgi:hypothetical protein